MTLSRSQKEIKYFFCVRFVDDDDDDEDDEECVLKLSDLERGRSA